MHCHLWKAAFVGHCSALGAVAADSMVQDQVLEPFAKLQGNTTPPGLKLDFPFHAFAANSVTVGFKSL